MARSSTGSPGSVDVVAVATRADVPEGVERRAAQRARRSAARHDPRSAFDEARAAAAVMRTRNRSGPSSSSSSSSSGSIASPSSSWARASTRTRPAPPSQPRVSDPARNASLSGSSSSSTSSPASARPLRDRSPIAFDVDPDPGSLRARRGSVRRGARRGPRPGPSRARSRRRDAPSRACRKKARSPGSPIAPATKRSGGSKM